MPEEFLGHLLTGIEFTTADGEKRGVINLQREITMGPGDSLLVSNLVVPELGYRTREEVEDLKAQWFSDGSWDLEDTEGFEGHREELLEFDRWARLAWFLEQAHGQALGHEEKALRAYTIAKREREEVAQLRKEHASRRP